MSYEFFLKRNLIPDLLIRLGIRRLCKQRLKQEGQSYSLENYSALLDELKASPIAINTEAANEQHYEVPADFYKYVLGKHLKYSCGYWEESQQDLDQSEEDMLRLSFERADLQDSQDILELGCGWGSLTLFMADQFPQSRITAVSNSASQKSYIDQQAKDRGLNNVTVLTADMNDFDTKAQFDRVVSIEMFEHMRNYQRLLEKVGGFLKPDGRLFVHIFTHNKYSYKYEVKDSSDWMSKYFFTGGIMPGQDLLSKFSDHLSVVQTWEVDGTHYQRTAEAWLRKMDANQKRILALFNKVYGETQAMQWWVYWRIFFMACAELFGFKQGMEWQVTHYLMKKV
ncbi:MAG: SAM-dependent methyltransferase [Cyclobacteriaceae bacterium]